MAVICTKSIPKRQNAPSARLASSTDDAKYLIHKMRSDIPKMGDTPLDKYDFKNQSSGSKHFVDQLLAVHPFHSYFLAGC